MADRKHKITIVVEGQEIEGWIDYEITSSMIEPADSFRMTRPYSDRAWYTLRRDARIRVLIDGISILDGFIDSRKKRSKDNTMEIAGRDRCGRLVQESAPAINYEGLEMSEAIRRLAVPWFSVVTLSDARNRRLRLGKGRKVPTGSEPIVIRRTSSGGRVHPGQSRWQVIESIVSQAGLLCWASADGRELVVGRPNYTQAPQFLILLASPTGGGPPSTCKELDYEEDNGDRFSVIAVVGTGGGTVSDYGINVSSRRAMVFDNEPPGSASSGDKGWSNIDGTGRDFLYPKRLLMPERDFDSNQDAQEIAEREQARRDFRRALATAVMPGHGQFITPGAPTIFAPNTIASVLDKQMDPALDDDFLIYACTYRGDRDGAEETTLELVPRGTEIVL